MVFLVAPLMILTGLCMSPALIARFPWYPKLFGGRQAARSLHFIGLMTLVVYTLVHLTLVVVVHFPEDIADMVVGSTNSNMALALWIASIALIGVVLFHIWATVYTLGNQRRFQVNATADRRTTHAGSVRRHAVPAAATPKKDFAVLSGEWVPARIRDLYETG